MPKHNVKYSRELEELIIEAYHIYESEGVLPVDVLASLAANGINIARFLDECLYHLPTEPTVH